MRLLLVEDDRMIGSGLRAVLQSEGHAVDWVRDIRAARAALASERFDLILLDLGLPASAESCLVAPEVDGITLLRELRGRRPDAGDRDDRARCTRGQDTGPRQRRR